MDPKEQLNEALTKMIELATEAEQGTLPTPDSLRALAEELVAIADALGAPPPDSGASPGGESDLAKLMMSSRQYKRTMEGVTNVHRIAKENQSWGTLAGGDVSAGVAARIAKGEHVGLTRRDFWPEDMSADLAEREEREARQKGARRHG